MEKIKTYTDYIKSHDFEGLLNHCDNQLTEKPKNIDALKFKARSFISLKKYPEALEILKYVPMTPKLIQIENITRSIVNYDKKYKKYSQIKTPTFWLSDR